MEFLFNPQALPFFNFYYSLCVLFVAFRMKGIEQLVRASLTLATFEIHHQQQELKAQRAGC